jgi:hypothetical protein
MQALLRGAWDLGPRLSDVFLAFYGGHVHMAAEALPRLAGDLDLFDCEEVAPDGAAGAIARCLESDDAAGRMRGMLRAVALRGFAPVPHEGSACAQALSQANLGGLVKTSATVVGLPEELRGGAEYGVVPASHFMVSAGILPPLPHALSCTSPAHPLTLTRNPSLLATCSRNPSLLATCSTARCTAAAAPPVCQGAP